MRFPLSALAFLALPLSAAETPNILLIYTDDVGFGDVGCYEGSKSPTPNIDRLATEGLRFTDAHCSAATCTPSRFAMLTGQYAFRQSGTGILSGDAALIIKPGTPTIPSLLQSAGYHTGVIGKWHLGLGKGNNDWNAEVSPNPSHIGFDHHYLIPATGDRVPCVYFEQGRVADHDPAAPIAVSYGKRIDDRPSGAEARDTLSMNWSHDHNQTIVNGISRIGWMTGGGKALWKDEDMADVLTGQAIKFMEDNKAKPFFLFFATQDIHVPRAPHSRFAGKSGQGPRGDAMVQADWCVGELLQTLERLGLAENTLVMFGSDNGPVLDDGYQDDANEKLGDHDPNGPWRAGKYSHFEGGTRTPFLVRWPARIKPGQVSKALFGQVDLARSLATLTGAPIPADACPDSRDELDTLLGEDPTGRPHLIHEASSLALRRGPWKFIPSGKVRDNLGPWKDARIPAGGALYNLDSDPGETTNLATKLPAELEAMKALLTKLRTAPDQ